MFIFCPHQIFRYLTGDCYHVRRLTDYLFCLASLGYCCLSDYLPLLLHSILKFSDTRTFISVSIFYRFRFFFNLIFSVIIGIVTNKQAV